MSIRLNGWQRLWVVASVAGLAVAVALAFSGLPTLKSADQVLVNRMLTVALNATVDRAEKNNDKRGQLEALRLLQDGGPEALRRQAYSDLSDMQILARIAVAFPEPLVQEALSNPKNDAHTILAELRFRHIAWPFAVWLVTCLVVYLVGFSVQWVRRGFLSPPSQ